MIYIVLCLALAASMLYLWWTVDQSARLYGVGIDLARTAYADGRAPPTTAIRGTLLLASAHEIVAFKAGALALAAIIVVLGALFVVNGAHAAYALSGRAETWNAALQTSSPGLVMITFGCVLVAWTLNSHSSLSEQPLQVTQAMAPASTGTTEQRLDALIDQSASPPVAKSTEERLRALKRDVQGASVQ